MYGCANVCPYELGFDVKVQFEEKEREKKGEKRISDTGINPSAISPYEYIRFVIVWAIRFKWNWDQMRRDSNNSERMDMNTMTKFTWIHRVNIWFDKCLRSLARSHTHYSHVPRVFRLCAHSLHRHRHRHHFTSKWTNFSARHRRQCRMFVFINTMRMLLGKNIFPVRTHCRSWTKSVCWLLPRDRKNCNSCNVIFQRTPPPQSLCAASP